MLLMQLENKYNGPDTGHSAVVAPAPQRAPGQQHICFSAGSWLYKERECCCFLPLLGFYIYVYRICAGGPL